MVNHPPGLLFRGLAEVGRNPPAGVIYPRFEPPRGLSPAAVRYLTILGYDSRVMAAALVDLAAKGRLTIKARGGIFSLVSCSSSAHDLFLDEIRLAAQLFANHESITLAMENSKLLAAARQAHKSSLERQVGRLFVRSNTSYLLVGLALTFLALASIWLTTPAFIPPTGSLFSFSLFLLGGYLTLAPLLHGPSFDPSHPWLRLLGKTSLIFLFLFSLPLVFTLLTVLLKFAVVISLPAVFLFAATVALNPLFTRLLKAPTLAGRRLLDEIEGFKLFLSVAEKERLGLQGPPQEMASQFEKFFPYALALEVEDKWSGQFAQALALTQVGPGELLLPWYEIEGSYSLTPFALAESLGSLAEALFVSVAPDMKLSGDFEGFPGGADAGGGTGW